MLLITMRLEQLTKLLINIRVYFLLFRGVYFIAHIIKGYMIILGL